MPQKKKSVDIWIETAYDLFAEVGPEAINVKSLSEKSGLPRSNFYYHFIDKEDLIEQLLHRHLNVIGDEYFVRIRDEVKKYIPDLYALFSKNKKIIMFMRQLFKHRQDFRYNHVYITLRKKNSALIIPMLLEYYRLDLPVSTMQSIWDTVSDAWYSQLNFDDYSTQSMCKLADNIMRSVLTFTKLSNI